MNSFSDTSVESKDLNDFIRVMQAGNLPESVASAMPVNGTNEQGRINLDPDKIKNGLGQLVLTLIKLIHELLERQAIKRIDAGSLSDEEVENLGLTLMLQSEELDRLKLEFGLEDKDLNLELGPLGKLL